MSVRLSNLPIVGYRKDGRPIFPIMGGDESDDAAAQAAAAAAAAQAAAAANNGPVEATDEDGAKLGFPKDTPVAQMNDAQQAAYWRNQSKVQQKKIPPNLTELQEAAQRWAEYQRTQKPAEEQAIDKAREETRQQVLAEAAEKSALANLRVVLQTRGKSPEDIEALIEPLNFSKLVKDGEVDTTKVMALADRIAPTGQAGGGSNGYGQGRGFGQPPVSRAEAGRLEAQRRFATKKP